MSGHRRNELSDRISRIVNVFEFVRERTVGKYLQEVVLQVLDVIAHYEFERKGTVVVDSGGIGEQHGVGVFDDMGQVKVIGAPKRDQAAPIGRMLSLRF